jgi:voltage-gated potassium channel
VDAFRAGRLVRVLRVLRLLRLGKVRFVRDSLRARLGSPLSSELVNGLGLVAVTMWLVTAAAFYLFEQGDNAGIEGFGDALWWSMTTLSTVGYGDLYPTSVGGRVVAVVTMLIGVGVIGTLAATMATVLVDVRDRKRRGLGSYRMQGHLLVVGWNEKAAPALREFRADRRFENTPIVVVAALERAPLEMPHLSFVSGDPMQRTSLERASADTAAAAIVFAADPNDPRSDHEAALTVLALRRINAEMHISAELVHPDNREHLAVAGCQETVEGNALTSALLVASVQDRGVSELVSYLISSETGSELHRVPVPESYVGGTYRDFAVAMAAESRPVLALARKSEMLINPDPTTEILVDDEAFISGPTRAT